ncbi:DUF3558 family protein [Dactylosporangium sp. NPDC048998]|uniref:DUF3558 family protein n=1 Tax=Dactylosporangium sp. NPDC048998 TaxID=3363976 RepID=UPI0037119ECF
MSHRIIILTAAAASVLALSACNKPSTGTTAAAPVGSAPAAFSSAPAHSPSAAASRPASTSASAAPSGSRGPGTLPDICTLMSKPEVNGLTGEQVTLMTDDGGNSGGSRYCQWQLSQGQLTIMVSLETRENFDVRNREATPALGVGTTAYSLSGHLYVWQDGLDVDVYVSSEPTDQANLQVERRAAAQILPRLLAATR